MKKILLLFACVLAILLPMQTNVGTTYAEEEMTIEQIEQELSDNVNSQLNGLDLEDFEKLIQDLTADSGKIFGSASFIEKLKSIVSGKFSENQESIWTAISSLLFENLLSFIPLLSIVVAIAVTYSLVSASRPKSKKKSIGDIVHFVCYGAILVLLTTTVIQMLQMTTQTLQSIKMQMEIAFPVLLTMLTAIGGVVSVGVYQPAVAVLSGTVMNIFTAILMPLFIFNLVFSILSNLTTGRKFDKFAGFFSSAFKWIIGSAFTIFSGFLAIQGITAGTYDGISIRTAKFAIKNSVPILGGYLSDGFNLIMASSVLIKNAVGAAGLLLLFATILSPVIKLVVFMFALKLVAAVLEPLTDSRISNFIHMLAKSIMLLIVIILGVAFMYLLLTGLIMCTANYF